MTTTGLPASQRSLIASRAANLRWSRVNSPAARREATSAATTARNRKWEIQADPDGVLSPEELAAAVARLKAAHYQLMALRSAQARAGRAKGGKAS